LKQKHSMHLKENSPLDRYDWTAKKINEITGSYGDAKDITMYDIGSRDNILKQYIRSPEICYMAFDLEPLDKSAEEWDIEQPFPYAYPSPQISPCLRSLSILKTHGFV